MAIHWQTAKNKNLIHQGFDNVWVNAGDTTPVKFTDDFIFAATADFRCPKAMVEITWASSAVDENQVITSNDINRVDRTGQLFNGETESGQKWAHLYAGMIADGSFRACPALDSEPQMGWFGSSEVSDGSGNFSTPVWLQITHDARAYASITVAGDSAYNEYPVDFTIEYTHSGGPTTQVITGNTERVYEASFTAIADVTAVKITISKWSATAAVVKLTQFAGALIETYDTSDIVDLNILEETNSDTGVVPIGNVSSNELDLSLLNTDRRFSYGNTDSYHLPSVRSGRKIRVWLGFVLPQGTSDATDDVPGYIVTTENGDKVGYMPYGVYWSKDWISSYDSMVTSTTAYDIVYRLSQVEFLKSENYTTNVSGLVNTVLNIAKDDIPELSWQVSADTATESLSSVAVAPKNYMEFLKDLAEATSSFTYVDRDGMLIVGSYLGVETPVLSWQEVDLSVYYSFKSQPKLDELINTVRVGYTEQVEGSFGEDIYSNDELFTIPASGITTLYISWSSRVVDPDAVVVALADTVGAPKITDVTAYAYGADIEVTGLAGEQFKITATGQPYELTENTNTVAEDSASVSTYGVREFVLSGNKLITSAAQAKEIADRLITSYGNLRQDGSISWPFSTLVDVGDTLEVTEFKSDTVETKDYFLIKRQSIKFDGSLQADTELRRG